MTPELVATVAFGIAILACLWSLHRDLVGIHREFAGTPGESAGLSERMARIEGLLVGFLRRQ